MDNKNKLWNICKQIDHTLEQFYEEVGKQDNLTYYDKKAIRDIIVTIGEQNDWIAKFYLAPLFASDKPKETEAAQE